MKKFLLFAALFGAIISTKDCFASESKSTNDPIQCSDAQIILARGSGAVVGHSGVYYDVERAATLASSHYNANVKALDLEYPASNLNTVRELFGAYTSAGRAYEFGRSVKIGIANLRLYYRVAHAKCPNMKFGFVGYSQGAMVVSGAAKYFDADKTMFLMMLGDPETYLPEGEGLFPRMCNGGWPSPWRVYVPNCRTSSGVFGARKPYELEKLKGKYALFCNRNDYICGSSKNPFNNFGHVNYDGGGLITWGISYLLDKAKFNGSATMRGSLQSISSQVPSNDFDSGVDVDEGAVADAFDEPTEISVKYDNDKICLKWEPIIGNNQYLLMRLNGFDLGYVSAESGAFEIRDIDQDEVNRLTLIWMDKDGNTGKPREVEKSDELVVEQSPIVTESIVPQSVVHSETVAKDVMSDTSVSMEAQEVSSIIADSVPQNVTNAKGRLRGLNFTNRADVVNVVIGMVGAGGLLMILFMKKRRGN